MSTFSEKLEEIRDILNLKGKDFAEQLGIPYRSYMNYKGGRTPPAEVLTRLIEEFSVNPAWLMTGQKPMFMNSAESDGQDNPDSSNSELTSEVNNQTDGFSTLPKVAQNSADSEQTESPEQFQLRLLTHLMDLQDENSELRNRLEDLEIQLQKSRSKARKIVRESR